jgi:hypothetical protein
VADHELVDLDDVLVLAFGVSIVEGVDCCDVILLLMERFLVFLVYRIFKRVDVCKKRIYLSLVIRDELIDKLLVISIKLLDAACVLLALLIHLSVSLKQFSIFLSHKSGKISF